MEQTKQDYLERLLRSYSHAYDVIQDPAPESGFSAAAEYHARDESYVASKTHTVYAAERNEYVYFALAEQLDEDALVDWIARARETGLARITPHSEHMFSYVTLVVLADGVTPEAKRLAKRYRFRKNFRLALHGWMEFHTAVLDLSSREISCNPGGKQAGKVLEQNLRIKK